MAKRIKKQDEEVKQCLQENKQRSMDTSAKQKELCEALDDAFAIDQQVNALHDAAGLQ